jgi:glycosyltransferase involved in cell wall biosynthesis
LPLIWHNKRPRPKQLPSASAVTFWTGVCLHEKMFAVPTRIASGNHASEGVNWFMLGEITPVLLTFNEAANIGRTLSCLTWAKDIVIVDSGSTDETASILAGFPQVRVFHRVFDTHGNQWRYATQETGISTNWILRLDADYEVTEALKIELSRLDADAAVDAYRISFDYAIFGRKLISSLYPPNTILLRKGKFSVRDKGHTEAWTVQGPVKGLKARIIHDDRKSTEQWMLSQGCYMRRELAHLRAERSGLRSWLRLSPPLMPLVVFLYCLFVKGLILNGRAGIFYALQRLIAEAALSLMVLEERLRTKGGPPSERA